MTFCVIGRDPNNGLLGLAQATSPLAVGSRCPFIRANVGAVSTQAYTDPELGSLAIQLLTMGYSPEKVLRELRESDSHFEWRQVGIVDRHGRTAVHTGKECQGFSSAITGDGYIVMGNYLSTDQVVPKMDQTWQASEGLLLEDRLMAVVIAARDAGGDMAGHRSACMQVHETEPYARTDLRVDFMPKLPGQPDAVDALQELLDRWKPMIEFYKAKPHNPAMPGWMDWLAAQGTPFQD
ncbi:DUF1028 domain-containing protein [Bordetella sp. 2513F-2]